MISEILKPILLTFMLYPAINLWNHINDAEDDAISGRDTPFTIEPIRKYTVFSILALYILSLAFVYINAKIHGLIAYMLVLTMTFIYSDTMITKLRLKRHYIGEIIVYMITIPAYILMLYSVTSSLTIDAIKLATVLTPLLISSLFIKDLKDISSDKKVGLKTLGTVFSPESLVKTYSFLLLVYFIIGTFVFKEEMSILPFIPVIGVIYGIYKFHRSGWRIARDTVKYFTMITYSGLLSLVLIIAYLAGKTLLLL
ncbi:UbiA family prenyltransferase [Geoglobus acetivorans]|uniref:UbiA family prenyltransferase n=1 Tax=Geoglobus acetivorans TaxID=565033 RepID=UPI00296F7A7B